MAAVTPMQDLERVDRFETVKLLGRGGMGEVYLARDPLIDRLVAVKLLSAAFDAEARERFTREARAAGRLQHEHIVTIFDVGEHGDRPFIAMEYVPGETLRSLIRREPPRPLVEMLRLIEDACVGLAFAHRSGVVHLDVKPENLLRRSDGRLKILDFGISRVVAADDTRTRQMEGTLRYMSPEQLAGRPVDHRSDVFGLGCVLYEVIARRPEFGGSMQDAVSRLRDALTPRLSDVVPDVHPGLDQMTSRAMAFDPADRYPDLEALRHDLASVRRQIEAGTARGAIALDTPAVADTPGSGTSAGRPTIGRAVGRKRPALLWSLTLGLVAMAVAAIWWSGPGDSAGRVPQSGDPSPPVAESPQSGPAQKLPPDPAVAFQAAVRQALAAQDRRTALQLLRDQPTLAPELVADLTGAARVAAAEARAAAEELGRGARQSATYRQASSRVEGARTLEKAGRHIESLAALWEAADLFSRVTPPGASNASSTQPRQPPPPSVPSPQSAAGPAGPLPMRTDGSEPPARPGPLAAKRPADLAAPPIGVTGTPPLPREDPAAGTPTGPVETDVRQSPTPEEAVRAALRMYEAAYEQRNLAALRRVFPALSAEQVEALGRTFDGAVSYRLQLRVLELSVGATSATAVCEVEHEFVPKVGNASRNTQRSTFHLANASGGWVIERVQSSARR